MSVFRKSTKTAAPVRNGVAKVPVVMQMEALECGAAALCMVMAYFGRWVPLEKLRKECGVTRDGTNLFWLRQAAMDYGLKAEAVKEPAEALRDEGIFPCIVFWQACHFAVVNGFKGDSVFLNDPASGKVRLPFEEFKRSYSGICLFLEPTEKFEPGGAPESILGFARERLRGTLTMFMLVILTTLIASLAGLLTPAFSRFFVDKLLTGKYPHWSIPFFVVLAAVSICQILSVWIKTNVMYKLQGKMAIIANTSLLWHILRLPLDFFTQRMAGDIVLRQQSNHEITATLIDTFAPLLLDASAIAINLFIMIDYSPTLAWIGIMAVLGNLILARVISAKRLDITRVQMRDAGKLNGLTLTGIDMIETIKSAGAENGFFGRWADCQADCNAQNVKYVQLNQSLGQLPPLVSLLTSNMVLFLGVKLIMSGQWTIGLLSAFNGYLSAFSAPASALIAATQSLQEMRTNMERIQDVLKYPTDTIYDGKEVLHGVEKGKLTGLVEIKDLTFGYNRLEPPLIHNFSLQLEPGRSVAIVGGSGCGKSTVAKLMMGLYQPWSGEILFDGKPSSQISRNVFTNSVACVDQNVTLFEDTVANNIRLWDKSIVDFDVILAARDAGIHSDIIRRDGDYHAPVAEGGRNFSSGQCQRIEIARVLAQDPSIIILDEATSALDTETEHRVIQFITNRNISRVIISHRLSIVRNCDEIIVMRNGEVEDRGRHEELMGRCGYYRELIAWE